MRNNYTPEQLPANAIFWKIDENGCGPLDPHLYFHIEKYNASKCSSHRFYKPISRVFAMNKLYGQEE